MLIPPNTAAGEVLFSASREVYLGEALGLQWVLRCAGPARGFELTGWHAGLLERTVPIDRVGTFKGDSLKQVLLQASQALAEWPAGAVSDEILNGAKELCSPPQPQRRPTAS